MGKRIPQIVFVYADAIEELRKYPDNSIDSICTDAPYGLGKEPDVVKMLTAWLSTGYLEVKGSGFMGKKWDAFVPQPLFWKEVIRVLKPGGHVLCFFGTRTYDWGVMAMRIAGFEIRDQIQWLYGSGFPKSLNIAKAIDKQLGAEREVIGISEAGSAPLKRGHVNSSGGGLSIGTERSPEYNITISSSDQAKEWDGWGTALKPANEPIVLARKPISEKNIAENVLKWGTGGIYIDGCRIDLEGGYKCAPNGRPSQTGLPDNYDPEKANMPDDRGRFPSNVILDETAAEMLNKQTGTLVSGQPSGYRNTEGGYHGKLGKIPVTGFGDSGGASRFFYVAKAAKSERNKGCDDLYWEKVGDDMKQVTKEEFEALNPEKRSAGNFHPTIKPVKLMQYMVRMITPPGGKCMDTFNGSGTTGIACELEGIDYIGIDIVPQHIVISEHRHSAFRMDHGKDENDTTQLELF